MPTHIPSPTNIAAQGNKPKLIQEYIGRVNSKTETLSIAHMRSPEGWIEAPQRPDFDEYTMVLHGMLHVKTEDGAVIEVRQGEAVIAHAGEWVQYSTPESEGAEYIAVCTPAFSPDMVHRQDG